MEYSLRTHFIILGAFLFNISALSSQQNNSIKSIYITFDKLVGIQNTSIYQGKLYTEKYTTINEKKQFFYSTEFLNGDVWFKGQPYFNQLLKYDVYEDELILRLEDNGNMLRLSKKDIDSFSIKNNHFINFKPKIITKQPSGFYEILFRDNTFELYAKHNKNMIQRKGKKYTYYEFKDVQRRYLLFYLGKHYFLNSKKDILHLFPNYKRQIKQLYKRAKKIFIDDDNALMIMVVKQLNSIL